MEKIENISYKDWQCLFSKETLLVYSNFTNFAQTNRKIYDANIIYTYSLGKKFIVHIMRCMNKSMEKKGKNM